MTRCPDTPPCTSCRELDATLDGYFDAHPRAAAIVARDPQTRFYLDVLAEVAHDHVVHLDRDALTARLAEGFARHEEAEAAAHHLAAQPLPVQVVADLQAERASAKGVTRW